jgi:Flp pilus assembly protein TadG
MKLIFKLIRFFAGNERGTATIEFVIAFPFMMTLIFATFDSGLMMSKYVVMENALDRVVRDVRLNGIADGQSGHTYFKNEVCAIATLIKDCESSLFVEMSPINTSGSFTPSGSAACIDRSSGSTPAVSFAAGAQNDIVYIRACLVVDRYFPSALSGIFAVDDSGGVLLVADSAYVVEPL